MIKFLKLKTKLIELSKNKDEITNYSLEIYTIILGYFAGQKDMSSPALFDNDETMNYLHNKIKDLLNTNYEILGLSDNSLDSFNIFIKNFSNEKNKEMCNLINNCFNYGYKYYIYYHNKYNSFLDYVLLHKHSRLEYKLKKFIK